MTARRNRNWTLVTLASLAMSLLALPPTSPVPSATGEDPLPAASRQPRLLASLQSWQKALQRDTAGVQQPYTPATATRPTAGADLPAPAVPAAPLDDIRRQLATWRQSWAQIDAWDAERPRAASRAANLVAEAHACAAERRHCHGLRDKLLTLDRTIAQWDALRRQEAGRDLRRLSRIVAAVETGEDARAEAIEELRTWHRELPEGTSPGEPMAQPVPIAGSPSPGPLRQEITSQLSALLQLAAPAAAAAIGTARIGHAEGLLADVDAYPAEKRRRQELQGNMRELAQQLATWLAVERRQRLADRQLLAQAVKEADAMVTKPALAEPPGPRKVRRLDDPEDFEYYELKQARTLKQISALPTIYGDPNQWQRLHEANRNAVVSPAAALPVGTLLVVPRDTPDKQ